MRILIIKLGALGDLAFARPALRYLAESLKKAEIDWLASEELSPYLKNESGIKNLVTVSGKKIYKGNFWSRSAQVLSVRQRLSSRYDLILLFHRDPKFLSFVLGKGPIVMPIRNPVKWVIPSVYPVVCKPFSLHETLNLKKVTDFGIHLLDPQLTLAQESFWSLPPNLSRGQNSSRKMVGLHLGGGQNIGNDFQLKRWPYMKELIAFILTRTDLSIRLFGSQEELAESTQALSGLSVELSKRVENSIGKTTLENLQSQIFECAVFVGPDSGPLHIADALGVPSLGLFGPTSPISWGLRGPMSKSVFIDGLKCRPCYKDDGIFPPCNNSHKCMQDLSVQNVFEALRSILSR
jgi:ADP-heptose:LPS heptosyltransferase